MFILFILGLVLGAFTIVFALQNMTNISVVFLAWHIDGSLALILVIAALAGALVCALLTIPGIIQNYIRFSQLRKQNRELASTLEDKQDQLDTKKEELIRTQAKKEVLEQEHVQQPQQPYRTSGF